MPTEWITTGEAAELSGYDIEYIRQMIRSGTIKASKRGRDWWIDRKAFISYPQGLSAPGDKRRGPKEF